MTYFIKFTIFFNFQLYTFPFYQNLLNFFLTKLSMVIVKNRCRTTWNGTKLDTICWIGSLEPTYNWVPNLGFAVSKPLMTLKFKNIVLNSIFEEYVV